MVQQAATQNGSMEFGIGIVSHEGVVYHTVSLNHYKLMLT